ncbi:MAG: ABC transporter permease [Armatimonadota bacterium]
MSLGARELSILVFLCVLLLLVGIGSPAFLEAQNVQDILVNSSYIAVAAVGMTMVIVAGGIDISIGSILAVCGITSGHAAKAGLSVPAVTLLSVLVGGLLGAVNGSLVAFAGIPAIIVTLGTMSILRGGITWATGGYWIRDLPPYFSTLGTGTVLGIPIPVLIAGLAVLAGILFMSLTPAGRRIYAVGGSPRAAELAGINVPMVTFGVFTACGALVGLAAILYVTRFSVIQSNAGVGFELLVITAVVVGGTNIMGGRGSVLGSVLGVLLLSTISSALTYSHVSAYWESALQGLLVLLAVLVDAVRTGRRATASKPLRRGAA